ncbi:hypothetical protein Bbelb_360110 [Branchiostoma belcheri]|nr:hypothetical protein Bbelb_360110 [Branchiostoma belcheri]
MSRYCTEFLSSVELQQPGRMPSSIVTAGSILSLATMDYEGWHPGQSLEGGFANSSNYLKARERGVKEAIYERMYNPTLNREGGLRVDLSGTWDLALPAPRTDNT